MTDFSRGTSQRFTFGPEASAPVWSPDGNRIVFSSLRDGKLNLYQKPSNGSKAEEVLLNSGEDKVPTSWSHDGRFLLYRANNKKTKGDLWILPMQGDPKPWPFVNSESDERDGHFSPDGHYIAYTSSDPVFPDVYVRQFSPPPAGGSSGSGGLWLVSKGGGYQVRWRPDGKELFYLSITDGRLMAVEVTTSPVFRAGVPTPLFLPGVLGAAWDVSPDGKRFLFMTQTVQNAATSFTMVQNWEAGLKK